MVLRRAMAVGVMNLPSPYQASLVFRITSSETSEGECMRRAMWM